jgi:hypothetical protein
MTLYQATTRYFCCGLEAENGCVVNAAPIIRWMVGKPLADVENWLRRKGGKLEKVSEDRNLVP